MQLSQDGLAQYQQQGYLVLSDVFSAAEMDKLRAVAERAARQAVLASCREQPEGVGAMPQAKSEPQPREYWLDGNRFVDLAHVTIQFEHDHLAKNVELLDASVAARHQVVRVIEPINDYASEFDALLDDPRLVRLMQQVLNQQSLALWTVKLNFKSAGVGSGFGWHQDSPYWVHDCNHVDLLPNLMLAIDAADTSNGCFRIIPGSHRAGILPGCDDARQLAGFYSDPSSFDEQKAVDLVLAPGSCVLFDPHLVHGSGVNTSQQARRALIATYQPGGHPALKSGIERPIKLPGAKLPGAARL